jgi:glyoxylase-like metal-dependent hydrolase (beta-lactamase superfamily II)
MSSSSPFRLIPALATALVIASFPAGCGVLPAVQAATGGTAIGSGGSNRSMMFLLPTDSGPIVIDLGWVGAEETLVRTLRAAGWEPSDVVAVLLTHAHRDHVSAWRVVAEAPFYLAREEVPLLTGQEPPPGALDGLAARLLPADRPRPAELDLRPFHGDIVLTFGRDTIRAFAVPGHTRGSTAYLARSVLFVGDAAGSGLLAGIAPPTGAYSLDADAGEEALVGLLERTAALGVRYVCTAHARCVTYEDAVETF